MPPSTIHGLLPVAVGDRSVLDALHVRLVQVEKEEGRVDEVAGHVRVNEQWLGAGQSTCRNMAKTIVHTFGGHGQRVDVQFRAGRASPLPPRRAG